MSAAATAADASPESADEAEDGTEGDLGDEVAGVTELEGAGPAAVMEMAEACSC